MTIVLLASMIVSFGTQDWIEVRVFPFESRVAQTHTGPLR